MNEELLIELNENIKKLNENVKMINKEVFTAKQAAAYLEIGYDTILRFARIGRIEHVKNGTDYLFKKEYLDRWLDKNKKGVV